MATSKPTKSNSNGAAESNGHALTDLWADKLAAWNNAVGALGDAITIPTEAYTSLMNECQEVVKSATEQVQENMQVLREGLLEVGRSSNPADFQKAAVELQQRIARQNAASGQKMVALATSFASGRVRAGTKMAQTLIEKSRLQP